MPGRKTVAPIHRQIALRELPGSFFIAEHHATSLPLPARGTAI